MSKDGEHVIWHGGDEEENKGAPHRITDPKPEQPPQPPNPSQEQGES